MNKIITIELEADEDVVMDVLTTLEHLLPYMADNVLITSRDGGLTP